MPESDAAECHRPMKKIASAFLLEGWREGHVMHVMTAYAPTNGLMGCQLVFLLAPYWF